ncbi:YbaK/EbsC family protein [Permianibacter sp. IMCC34836]|uniref:aminoacyl-tRNA deacylase n=1 Tax=Permianibacter fluminis TaxID=2738515 RepID=UPI001551943F|nr:YbaK/EbsC family protein [Permianibacter fluminis]NQD35577.1 YbaK/EbsC family protein [Permianibacter fluminis]
MAIAPSMQSYLHRQGVQYSLLPHPYAERSARAASCCGVPLEQMIKAVLVQDQDGQHLLALIPADRQLSLFHLSQHLGRHFQLVDENDVVQCFSDCDNGAVPALGAAYDIETVIDDSLRRKTTVYLEAGDHEDLIQLTQEQFRSLTHDCVCGYFSISSQTGARLFAE